MAACCSSHKQEGVTAETKKRTKAYVVHVFDGAPLLPQLSLQMVIIQHYNIIHVPQATNAVTVQIFCHCIHFGGRLLLRFDPQITVFPN